MSREAGRRCVPAAEPGPWSLVVVNNLASTFFTELFCKTLSVRVSGFSSVQTKVFYRCY